MVSSKRFRRSQDGRGAVIREEFPGQPLHPTANCVSLIAPPDIEPSLSSHRGKEPGLQLWVCDCSLSCLTTVP